LRRSFTGPTPAAEQNRSVAEESNNQMKPNNEEVISAFEMSLDSLSQTIETKDFPEQAKAFEADLKQEHRLTSSQRSAFWDRYQSMWEQYKRWRSSSLQSSNIAKGRYIGELDSLDFSYDGLPVFQTFANWEQVGEKIRAARGRLKDIQAAIKEDRDLISKDKGELYDLINTIWQKTQQKEETTFLEHSERATVLYNDAYEAIENLSPHEAATVLKSANSELHSLWLSRDDREKYRTWFDELWERLKYKRDEAKKRYEDSRLRQEERLEKLRAAHIRALNALEHVRDNISANESRLADARSSEYAERVSEWIQEGENKARDIELSIEELEAKIREAEEHLNR
jgi:hypothetical protein